MKTNRFFHILSTCILCLLLCPFVAAQPKESVITGKWVNSQRAPKELKLLSIHNGTLHELASSTLQEGKFQLRFNPEREGFYAIAPNAQARPYYHLFYFKPGDNLSVEIENGAFRLTGSGNTPENQVLEQWHKLLWPLESKTIYYFMNERVTYQEFFPLLEQMLPEIQAFPQARTGNPIFNASFEQFKKLNLTDVAVAFISTPQQVHPQSKDYPDFYRNISLPELTATTAILNYPNGPNLLQHCHMVSFYANPNISTDELSRYSMNIQEQLLSKHLIANDTVKGEIILKGAASIKTLPGIELYRQKYGRWLVTNDQKQRFGQLASQYEKPQPTEATDFCFEDVNGKQVALSDFKGKVVYVDVWAT